jgi:hypothetical protein
MKKTGLLSYEYEAWPPRPCFDDRPSGSSVVVARNVPFMPWWPVRNETSAPPDAIVAGAELRVGHDRAQVVRPAQAELAACDVEVAALTEERIGLAHELAAGGFVTRG